MLKQNSYEEISVFSGADINQILELAQKSHEKYMVRPNNKDLDRALVYYLEAVKLNPELPEVHYKLASLLWEKGDIDVNSAIKHCKKAVELAPWSYKARLHLGCFYRAAGRYNDSEINLKEAVRLAKFKSSKPRLVLAATILDRLKYTNYNIIDVVKAGHYFMTGIAASIYDFDIIRMLYNSSLAKFTIFKYNADANMQKHLRNYKKAQEIYEKAAEETERRELFYSKIGDMFIELQNPHQAIEYYRHALQESPESVAMWAKYAEILQKYDKRNLEEIIDCYTNISRLEPGNSKVFYELGHLYLRNEDKFSAVNSFKRALEIEPRNAFYHNSLAYALVQLQDYDGAINEYQRAIRINPDPEWTSIVSQALGAIYHQVKDNLEAAIIAYQTAILLDKNNVDAFVALAEAYQDKNDYDNAINCYCSAVKLDSGSARIYGNLGLLLWEKNYLEEAVIAYQKAISIDPEYAIAYNNLGVVYLEGCNDYNEALNMFALAVKYGPNYTLAYFNMGRAFEAKCSYTKAADYYQMALDINQLTEEMDDNDIQDRLYNLFSAE